jgi:hypothetical protein
MAEPSPAPGDAPGGDEPVWKASHERILKKIGEQCFVYEILHRGASEHYLKLSRRFTVPVIVLSTISGTLSFSMESIPEDYRSYIPFGVGFVNIFVGILSTISSLLLINENYKLHVTASSTFGKMARCIACKLELPAPDRGVHGTGYIQEVRAEFESALEKAPALARSHIAEVREKHYALHPPTIVQPVEIEIHHPAHRCPQPAASSPRAADVVLDVVLDVDGGDDGDVAGAGERDSDSAGERDSDSAGESAADDDEALGGSGSGAHADYGRLVL